MDKNTQYLIAGGIVVVLILLAGVAYMQWGTQNNTATPTATPTAVPSATVTATPTATPTTVPSATATATATPTTVPSATATATPTPTATPSVTSTPTATPTPSADPYMQPGWPTYAKQYGEATPKGTITAYVWDKRGPLEGQAVGVVQIPSKPMVTSKVSMKKPSPSEWKFTGADGYVYLGEFEYGTYLVVYDDSEAKPVTIDDSNRNPIVYFEHTMDD